MKTIGRVIWAVLFCAATAAWGQNRFVISTIAGTNNLGDNGPATQALIFNPIGVAVDAQHNIYIADTFDNLIRKVTPAGIITTIACTGIEGSIGDGGPATQAQCDSPNGVTVDNAGNVYFSDTFNYVVRKVGLDGTISAVAGNGFAGYSGDGGPATSASLNEPAGLAFDASGNLYVADNQNNRIRQITPDGNIHTVAGTGSCGSSGDGGLATQGLICDPLGIATDSQGRVLIADAGNSRIRRFVPGGAIVTVAGSSQGFGGDGGPATAASLLDAAGVAVNSQGAIYIADSYNHRIRVVGTDGQIFTLAGSVAGFSGDGGLASNALLDTPEGLAIDNQGDLYIADSENHRIRVVPASQVINTVAGSGHDSGDNGPALSAVMSDPAFVAMDAAGDLFVADQDNHVIRKIDTTGKITTVAGTGIAGALGDGGPALSAQFDIPQGLAVDSTGNVYVADYQFSTVRKFTPGGSINRIAGGGSGLGDGGPAQSAGLSHPQGIALDAKGNLYIADTDNNRVRMVTPAGIISTVIGNGTEESSGDGGLAVSAGVNQPWDVKVGNDGTLYITESLGGRVRAISPAGTVRTFGYVNYPVGLAVDGSGNVYVSEQNQVVTVSSFGAAVPIAGGGFGFGGDGGPALSALLNYPEGLVTDAHGNVYICDQSNNRIRKLTPDTPAQVVLISGNQQTGAAGTALPLPLIVQVNGITGSPYPGITVTYAITSGAGRLSASQTTTGPNGQAGVTLFLVDLAGPVTVTATVSGLPPVTFTATSVNAPVSINILGGNNQTGIAGSILPQILDVVVYGANQQPLSGVTVTFAVVTGSATLNPASMQTAFDGSAYTQVTLGNAAGAISVSATVTGLAPVTFTLTATPANGPQISPGGVVSAGLSTPPVQTTAPNAIVSIFGKNFAPAGTSRGVSAGDLVNGMLPTNLTGVCVTFGALRAPIFLITPGQLNVQTPDVGSGAAAVQVITNCDTASQEVSSAVNVSVQQASPEFFYASNNGSGNNPVAATDGVSGAGVGDPARLGPGFALAYPGETVTIYATGLGLTSPPFAAGQLPPAGAQVNNVTVSIDGVAIAPSALQYAGVAPLNAGLYQLNLILPASLTSGDHTIGMTVAGVHSPAGYISVGSIP